MITYDDFAKLDLRIARVLQVERVEDSEKLLKLQLDMGKDEVGMPVTRQIVAGIGKVYSPESLIGKSIVIIANLEPRSLMGVESNGMLLAANGENGSVILLPETEVLPGTGIK